MLNYKDYSHLFYSDWNIHYHEKPTWDYMKTLLNPGCVFFDIGCQKGIFAEGVIDLFGKNCEVYGFDVLEHPDSINLQEKYSNFEFINSAVGDGQNLNCMINYDTNTFVDNQKSISLDSFCEERNINKIDFIKIDVDGCEESILKGSKNILKNYSPILMIEMVNSKEDHDRLRINEDNKIKCNNILLEHGYRNVAIKNDINYFYIKENANLS